MAVGRVKVYEETRKRGIPIWAWLLPLLVVLALLAYLLLHHHSDATTSISPAPAETATESALPGLGSVHFDTDRATLTPAGQATLTQAAAYMKQNPSARLRVEGYTDSTGSDPHNDSLANQRAVAVKQFLVGQGVEASRLTGEGFGPEKPVATNSTESGKADNRRVELFRQR